jgi:hypothetical protein
MPPFTHLSPATHQACFYIYLDSENNPVIRIKSIIDEQDPGFLGRTPSFSPVWTVDAADDDSVLGLLQALARKQLPSETVRMIAAGIGVNLEEFIAKVKAKTKPPR